MTHNSLSSLASLDEEAYNPNPLTDNATNDAQSELSPVNSRYTTTSDRKSLRISRSETRKSLQELGLSSEIPTPDLVHPPVADPIFPEEYTLETDTGLVQVQTLQSLGRRKTVDSSNNLYSIKSGDSSTKEKLDGLDPSISHKHALDPETEFVTFTVGDPENPHNWPMWIKWSYTALFSIFVICAAYGSSCLATGLPTINEKFGVSTEVSTLAVSLFVIGFGVGSIFWSPLSEQPRFGRRLVYFISFGLYVIFNIPCALAKNIGTVLVCRFLCGVFSSSALANVGASLVDIHNETRGLAIAFFSFCPYSGPVLGGIVNGFISVNTGRYELMVWVNMAFAGVMWIIISFIPETYAPTILRNRAAKLRKQTGNPKIMTEQEATPMAFKEIVNTHLLRPIKFIVQEPALVIVCGYVMLIYSLLYAFFFAYPVIFNTLYGYEDDKIGLMFIPILIGAALAVMSTIILEKNYKKLCMRRTPTPEDRLIGAMIGSPFPCIALFILGATSYKHIIWVGPASSGIAFGYGMVLIYYSLNNYIIDTYARVVASALGTKVITRLCGGAAFPLFITQMYNGLGLQWASWLLAFVSLAMVLIPFLFYAYGKALRAKLCKEDYSAVHH